MHPTLHCVATLVEKLSRLCVQGIQHGRVGSLGPLFGSEKIFLPLFDAVEMKQRLVMHLLRVLSGGEGEQHPVADDGRVGKTEVVRNPGRVQSWPMRVWVVDYLKRHDAAVRS